MNIKNKPDILRNYVEFLRNKQKKQKKVKVKSLINEIYFDNFIICPN
jgi:hypothetical protein